MVREKILLPYFDACSIAAVDSMKVIPGALFFALKGKRVDGHNFLEEASRKGAKAAVVQNSYNGPSFGMELFPVEDPLTQLQLMAKERHKSRGTPMIGVTGSVGKTSTKEAIWQLLSTKFVVGKTPGNANSQVGVPLAILNDMTGEEEIAVFEMGLSHQGNLKRLVDIAPPKVGVITAIELVHAENFDSLEDIAKAKGEILSHPDTEWAVIHKNIQNYPFRQMPAYYYGIEDAPVAPQLPEHLRINLAAAALIARRFGVEEEKILKEVAKIHPFERRFEVFTSMGITIVNDAYNASEPSMVGALKSLPQVTGRRIGAIGEMLELGRFSQHCHENVAKVAVENLDEVFLVGEGSKPILTAFQEAGKSAQFFSDPRALFNALKVHIAPGDLVLLKGSRFWGLSDFADDYRR